MLKRFKNKKVDGDWLNTNFPCMMACPAHTNAGRYVGLIAEGRFEEAEPFVREGLRRIGGDRAVEGYNLFPSMWEHSLSTSLVERKAGHIPQGPFAAYPSKNTRDRATAMSLSAPAAARHTPQRDLLNLNGVGMADRLIHF